MKLLIRSFAAGDTDRLRAICEQTSIERPFLPYLDEPRFASTFFLDPYLKIEGESCFVAELGGEIVGYLVGTCDARRFQRQLDGELRRRIAGMAWMHLGGALCGRYRHAITHRFLARIYLDVLLGRASETSTVEKHVDLARYPAHCHMQIAPDARAKGAGLMLMLRFHEHLKKRAVPGQYSSIVEEVGKEGYSRMMQAMRFRVVHEDTFSRAERPSLIHAGMWRERILAREF